MKKSLLIKFDSALSNEIKVLIANSDSAIF